MNTSNTENASELEHVFRQIVAKGKFTDAQKKDIFEKMEGAILLRTGGMLIDRLSEENKKLLDTQDFKNTEDAFQFLADTVSKDEFKKIAAKATAEVLSQFLGTFAKKL